MHRANQVNFLTPMSPQQIWVSSIGRWLNFDTIKIWQRDAKNWGNANSSRQKYRLSNKWEKQWIRGSLKILIKSRQKLGQCNYSRQKYRLSNKWEKQWIRRSLKIL